MLTELRIQDFAIIEQLDLRLAPGLVVFTGETGAGKSIILDALGAILGERMDAGVIRLGSSKAVVEGLFKLDPDLQSALNPLLDEEGLLDDPAELTLGREVRAEGRSVARVNGRSTAVSLQSDVGSLLVDLHGQSEHLSLLKVSHHLDLLDRYARHADKVAGYQSAYRDYLELKRELESLRAMEQDAQTRQEMLGYQVQEISAAKLQPDEEDSLRQERNRLANAETLFGLSQGVLIQLDDAGPESQAATDLLGQAVHQLRELARIDPEQEGLAERAENTLTNLADISFEVRRYLDGIEFSPKRLDQIEERLDLINQLKRKYGGSVDSVLQQLEEKSAQLTKVENVKEEITELESKIHVFKEKMSASAKAISQERSAAAEKLAKDVEDLLDHLQMKSARFMVSLLRKTDPEGLVIDGEAYAFDSRGVDTAEFLIEPNPGEGFKPLAKIASGGETSRLMLALKHALAEVDHIPTLIFDEIDSGIGGRVGAIVGQLLWQLSRRRQVLCVTHLPQLAAYGDQHFHVRKETASGRTQTIVEELTGTERETELAAMIGPLTPGTRQSAQEILHSAGVFTGKIQAE